MNTCICCQADMEDGRAKCPVCGFPVIHNVQGNQEEMDNIKKMADEYGKKKRKGIRIGITAYGYCMDNEELKLDKTEEIFLAWADELSMGKIVWCEKDFARIDSDETVSLHVSVKKEGKDVVFQDVKIKLPRIQGFCHVGVELKEGFQVELILGNETIYERSERLDLL